MINARAETVPEKPFDLDARASRRLIVPVPGFYERMARPVRKR
jgi:putative SOS response-associated peptidase YedK